MKHSNFLIAALLFAFVTNLNAQDIITKTDSSKIFVDLLEINPSQVKYKLFNYPTSPLCVLNKTEIAYVTYRTGATERFLPKPVNYASSLNRYGDDILSPAEKDKKCERFYKYKNYIGFNYVTFLNNCVGFNYVRDFSKANLMVSVPVAVGFASPVITNSLYSEGYLSNTTKFTYNKLNYQVGISAFFVPNMKREANFLIGPSFNYSSFNTETRLDYTVTNPVTGKDELRVFKNSFELRRKNYGVTTGFMARFSERISMNMTVTLGYRIDTYNKPDAFGVARASEEAGSKFKKSDAPETIFYANYLWSIGYRF